MEPLIKSNFSFSEVKQGETSSFLVQLSLPLFIRPPYPTRHALRHADGVSRGSLQTTPMTLPSPPRWEALSHRVIIPKNEG